MVQLHEINISSDAKTNILHLNAKQFDKKSHRISCRILDCTNELTENDTAKATAYINNRTVDVIDCSINVSTQKINFLLSAKSLMQAGRLLIDVSVFTGTSVKFTFGSIVIDVIKSADGNVQQNIDSGNSLFEKLQEISNKVNAINLNDVYSTISGLNRQTGFAMKFIFETISIGATSEYKLTANDIAPSSPVYVSIKARTSTDDTLVRSDGEDLVDLLTNKIVDSTMTDIQITADDVIAGIKSTDGMSIQVKYYNANCEDLLQMIKNRGSSYTSTSYQQRYNVVSLPTVTETTYTLEGE